MFSIVEAIRERAQPQAIALVQKERSLTYEELFSRCDAIAGTLRSCLIPEPGRVDRLRVGVHYPSCLDYVPLSAGAGALKAAVERAGGSGRELCWFPDPIGAVDCYRPALPDPLLSPMPRTFSMRDE